MINRQPALVLLVSLTLTGPGCSCLARLAPGDVAAGVARLTVRSAGYYTKLSLDDAKCGFESPQVKRGMLVQGLPGSVGAVTWTIKDCVISLPRTELTSDCLGDIPIVEGKFTVSGTRHIVGTITGDPATPVIPTDADSVRITLDVVPENFTLKKSHSTAWLTNVSGTLHFVVAPHIALSRSLGVCAVQTLDLSFTDVTYTNAQVVLASGDTVVSADVPTAKLSAQSGKWVDRENSFSGTVTVWDNVVALPLAGDQDGLDPAYTPKSYADSVSCNPDLVLPVSYACPSLKQRLVHGVSRLTVKEAGAMASLLAADTRCGFSAPAVLSNATLRGNTGGPGSATFTLPAPCTFSWSSKTAIATDCLGVQTFAQGTVTVTGTETLTGVLTGDVAQPIAPNGRDPATLALTAQFTDFTLSDSAGGQALKSKRGTLSATVRPRVGLDVTTGICSNTTSIAAMDLAWRDATLNVNVDGFDFDVDVSQASLTAQSGTNGTVSNQLTGTVVSDGQPVTVPPVGVPPVLDPTFDEVTFLKGFSCAPGFKLADADADCSLDHALALNAARLTVQTAGTLASMIQNNTDCGFSALSVKTSPTQVTGSNGQAGTIDWDVQSCLMSAGGPLLRDSDCLGVKSYVSGNATVSAHRLVTGERNTAYVLFDSIVPHASDAMTITLKNVTLAEFSSFSVAAQASAPTAQLIIHQGTLTGVVSPGLGERTSTPGVFDVGTPVAHFTDVTLSNATASLLVAGKRFELTLPALRVSATNGTLLHVTNSIDGAVSLGANATLMTLPVSPLDPSYEQATFDQSYACTADLKAPLPH